MEYKESYAAKRKEKNQGKRACLDNYNTQLGLKLNEISIVN